MLSEHEQRRLADIEAELRHDTRFAQRFDRQGAARFSVRQVVAIVMTALAVAGLITGLATHVIAVAVLSICLLGVAAGVWTFRRTRRV